jgi:hypothetical protein
VTRLLYSEELYQLLHRVSCNLLVLHDSCEVHAQGWSWVGSDMSPLFQELCGSAFHARLIDIGEHQIDGSPASLSAAGRERYLEFRARYLAETRGVSA